MKEESVHMIFCRKPRKYRGYYQRQNIEETVRFWKQRFGLEDISKLIVIHQQLFWT